MPLSRIFVGIARGLNTVAAANGWTIRECENPDFLGRAISGLNPAGVVFGKIDEYYAKATPADLRGRAVVAVEADLTDRGVPSAVVEDEAIGAQAADHLLDRGLEHFAAFAVHGHRWAARRVRGFADRVSPTGRRYHSRGERFQGPGAGLAVTDRDIGRWLRSLPMPVGVFTCCDPWGKLVVAAAEAAGLRVPEDVAIVGADNDEFTCELSHPPLSSVVIPWNQVGVAGGQLLLQILSGRRVPPEHRIIVPPSGVAVRRSSDTVAVADSDVASALSYILNHAHHPIGVPDVVRHTGTYRRRLEQRFKLLVGRTIQQEIRRVRIELAKRLLATTDLPMPAVATAAGFANAKRLSEVFRAETGSTPTAYGQSRRMPIA